jgi:hypothetical protein
MKGASIYVLTNLKKGMNHLIEAKYESSTCPALAFIMPSPRLLFIA